MFNKLSLFEFLFSRFLSANEVALHAWGKALSTSASQESDDLRASRGAGLLIAIAIPQPSQQSPTKACPSPGHAFPPRHLAALPACRSVRSSPEPRSPAPASVRQLTRPQSDHRGAQ